MARGNYGVGKVEPVEMAALAVGMAAGAAALLKLLERMTDESEGPDYEHQPH